MLLHHLRKPSIANQCRFHNQLQQIVWKNSIINSYAYTSVKNFANHAKNKQKNVSITSPSNFVPYDNLVDLPLRFRVALVGRTNVGKSTLYNRLTKSRSAIVHNVPGTTRDRRYATVYLAGMEFDCIDTGGLADSPSGSLEEGMLEQTRKAVHEAHLVLFLVDGRQGITPIDTHFARWLRKENPKAPVHLVANKVEGYPHRWEDEVNEFYELGMGTPIPFSAEHGEGITDLLDVLIPPYDKFEKEMKDALEPKHIEDDDNPIEESQTNNGLLVDEYENIGSQVSISESSTLEDDEDTKRTIKLAIVGRPNVGKSTLINRIVRTDRVLTGPEPGVTRDSVEVPYTYQGRVIKLVDTAGIRRYSKRDHENQIENLSVRDSFRAIDSAQVVVVVVDMSEPKLIHMDLTIADRVIKEGRALIIAANKSDLALGNGTFRADQIREELETSLAQVKGIPVVPISAITGHGIRHILPEVVKAHEKWDLRVTTGRLNRWIRAMSRHHPPPTINGKTLNIKYLTQVKSRPPTFALFCNKPKDVPVTYERFLLAQLREEFDMVGVPVRLLLRGNSKSSNPFEKRREFQRRTSSLQYGKPRTKVSPKPVAPLQPQNINSTNEIKVKVPKRGIPNAKKKAKMARAKAQGKKFHRGRKK